MGKNMKVKIDGKEYTIDLNDSITAKELMYSTPFETSLISSCNHFYGPIPERLSIDQSKVTSNPHKGGVYYADHVQSIVIFYGNRRCIKPFEMVYIGEVQEDLTDLRNIKHRVDLEVEKCILNVNMMEILVSLMVYHLLNLMRIIIL